MTGKGVAHGGWHPQGRNGKGVIKELGARGGHTSKKGEREKGLPGLYLPKKKSKKTPWEKSVHGTPESSLPLCQGDRKGLRKREKFDDERRSGCRGTFLISGGKRSVALFVSKWRGKSILACGMGETLLIERGGEGRKYVGSKNGRSGERGGWSILVHPHINRELQRAPIKRKNKVS